MSTPDEQEMDLIRIDPDDIRSPGDSGGSIPEFEPGDTVSVFPVRLLGQSEPSGFLMFRPDGMTGSEPDTGDAEEDPSGPVERALRADLSRLRLSGQLAGTLVASATALAQAMDNAPADKIAGIGRELREHVKRIEEIAGDDDETQQFRADLSTPV